MLNNQSTENKGYVNKGLSGNWKWEKRHVLLLISGICLLLWFLAPALKESKLVKNSLSYLPLIGGLTLISEQLFKLI